MSFHFYPGPKFKYGRTESSEMNDNRTGFPSSGRSLPVYTVMYERCFTLVTIISISESVSSVKGLQRGECGVLSGIIFHV